MRAVALLVVLLTTAACRPAASAPSARPSVTALASRDATYTINHDRVLRTYVLHVPPNVTSAGPLPLVIAYHDDGGTSEGAIRQMGWSALADREGFLVAYPQADKGIWNDASARGAAGRVAYGDVGFTSSVISDVDRHTKVDPRRVFLTGFGTGASLAWLAGAQLSTRVAAIGPVAGSLLTDKVTAASGVSALFIIGSADPQNPLNGGTATTSSGAVEQRQPIGLTTQRWAQLMGCDLGAKVDRDDGAVRVLAHRNCRDGALFLYYTFAGLGHRWPDDASSLLWTFFTQHPKA